MLIRTDFQSLLATAKPGEHIVYFTGDLMFQRQSGSQLSATADAAWDAHLAGQCVLVQRRVSLNQWDYIAVKLAEPHRPVEYFGAYDKDHLHGKIPHKPAVTAKVTKKCA